jgi:hypothetical protein
LLFLIDFHFCHYVDWIASVFPSNCSQMIVFCLQERPLKEILQLSSTKMPLRTLPKNVFLHSKSEPQFGLVFLSVELVQHIERALQMALFLRVRLHLVFQWPPLKSESLRLWYFLRFAVNVHQYCACSMYRFLLSKTSINASVFVLSSRRDRIVVKDVEWRRLTLAFRKRLVQKDVWEVLEIFWYAESGPKSEESPILQRSCSISPREFPKTYKIITQAATIAIMSVKTCP